MRYVSLFSGIEAASVAWGPLGWEPSALADVDPFACAVLAERFPGVPNLGDVTRIDWEEFVHERGRPDVVVGGSPCQSFSIAGSRESLSGESRLCFEYVRAVREIGPRWLVWENVPGVLSARDNAFGQFLCELWDCGFHDLAWRVLDAQFFGVAQRRRRVFLVGCIGDGMRAPAVLFEREGVLRDPRPSRAKRAEVAAAAGVRAARCSGFGCKGSASAGSIGFADELAPTLLASRNDASVLMRTRTLAFDTSQVTSAANGSNPQWDDPCHTLMAAGDAPAVVCATDATAHAGFGEEVAGGHVVRRLTPVECERLQGFPDGWTCIPYRGRPVEKCPDGLRYRALGNSMAVPVMRWIGERIADVDSISRSDAM